MIKFIPQFSCWKRGPNEYLVLASCAKTHDVLVYIARTDGTYHLLDLDTPVPDVRACVPCKWHALGAKARCAIRGSFLGMLEEKHGNETNSFKKIAEWHLPCVSNYP